MACPTVWPKLRIARRPPSRSSAATTSALISTERSEEHTSELQSRSDLVCRLLLEKKKKTVPLPRCSNKSSLSVYYRPTAAYHRVLAERSMRRREGLTSAFRYRHVVTRQLASDLP